jgi:hypothetical protein
LKLKERKVKKTKALAIAAVCAILASCFVFTSCITLIEGEVELKSTGRSAHQNGPAPQPAPHTAPAPRKAPQPKTRHERKDIVLNVGQSYTVNEGRGDQDECYSSDSGVINLESQEGSRGGLRFNFKAYNGGSAVITYKRYKDGYLELVKEIHVTVRYPAPPPAKKGGSPGVGRKAYQ